MTQQTLALVAAFCALPAAVAGRRIDLPSKHGLAVTAELTDDDTRLFASENSPISWYFNWSPRTTDLIGDAAVFIPLIHGLGSLEQDGLWQTLDDLPGSSTHLFAFNEPDEEKENGGSGISPREAAEAYLEHIVPLRTGESEHTERTWNVSHPAVTGSTRGLEWLRDFNESCYDIAPDGGCPADFVSVHYYGDFLGLASWIGTLHEFYNNNTGGDDDAKGLWITEMAVPQGDQEVNLAMLKESMDYLDGLDYVDGYAWFGAFREGDSNEWTGEGVSLLDDEGELTDVGREYMGGETSDFQDEDGDQGGGSGDGGNGDEDSGCNILQPNVAAILLVLIGAVMWAIG